MSVYISPHSEGAVCVSNICALSPHSVCHPDSRRSVRTPLSHPARHPPRLPACASLASLAPASPCPSGQDFHPAQHQHRLGCDHCSLKRVQCSGNLLPSPGSSGFVLLLARTRLGATGGTGLPVLPCGSLSSLCALLNQAGLLKSPDNGRKKLVPQTGTALLDEETV